MHCTMKPAAQERQRRLEGKGEVPAASAAKRKRRRTLATRVDRQRVVSNAQQSPDGRSLIRLGLDRIGNGGRVVKPQQIRQGKLPAACRVWYKRRRASRRRGHGSQRTDELERAKHL